MTSKPEASGNTPDRMKGETMTTFQIQCANIIIEIRCFNESIKDRCAKYLINSSKSDIIVSPNIGHFNTAKKFMANDNVEDIEFAAILCDLHEKLIERMACSMHAAVISVDGLGYAFAAQSGVGKTTHINLWKKRFGDRCEIVNGDKPILTFDNKNVFASGSPWCGKEGFSKNITVPLKAICFLERAEVSKIRLLSSNEIIDRLFYQLSIPKQNTGLTSKCLKIANALIQNIPFYLLQCNISDEAVKIAYEEMNK